MDRQWQDILRVILGAAAPFIPGGAIIAPAADKILAAIQAIQAKTGLDDKQMEEASELRGLGLDLKAVKWQLEHPPEVEG